MSKTLTTTINGIDVEALRTIAGQVAADPKKGMTSWGVTTTWKGATRCDTKVTDSTIGGQHVGKNFTISTDEPLELLGSNKFANPQEYLMASLNACMAVGYIAGCSLEGIEVEELRIECSGDIDLRGFLGLDPNVKRGYDHIDYTVHIKGNGTPEQFQKVHETVSANSPNRYNLSNAIKLNSKLVVE